MHFKIVKDYQPHYALWRFACLIKFVCTKFNLLEVDLNTCIGNYLLNMCTLHGYSWVKPSAH
jgi:hypothetical protein